MSWLKISTVILLFVTGVSSWARPVVVFDLDHTLVDTNTRIIVMLRELAVEFDIPELLAVTSDQVEALRRRDLAPLKLKDPAVVKLLFGRREDHSLQYSPFGARFYRDSSYLVHDGVIPGAPEFVDRIARLLDADVYYLTGRTENEFRQATIDQLMHWNFPGFSSWRTLKGHARLILKPNTYEGSTDAFKVAEFKKLEHAHQIVAVFDDARRNVNAFAGILPADVPIVRITRNVADRTAVNDRVDQITNYVYNTLITTGGDQVAAVNGAQLDGIIARAVGCARRLAE